MGRFGKELIVMKISGNINNNVRRKYNLVKGALDKKQAVNNNNGKDSGNYSKSIND
jgi:hypothetical protein